MENFFNDLIHNTVSDVMVSGYIDTKSIPIFHPMYEKIYIFIHDDIFQIYIEDGIIKYDKLKTIDEWFELDEDDTFSLMSIYSQLFKTEQDISIESICYKGIPFSDMIINYWDGENKKHIYLSPNNFFGFTFL
ncbi:hypothetical protein [Snodgrassella alvi]|jgi:hypothetical protein|uniref:Uncharacterized protein n=1 Tax=Snodgrassella alvi TaxID=1196083 RepID=A0A2N9WSB5_9NEIS|nr:hypothetical protein [Snodgrassella alvi]PIT13101.1 hypothetical protein BGI33_12440 [Snodgrassella alvi]PIT13626.1 hypothetical protein BGI32_08970 [Snodgrassella alvi]PIT15011.1 hypothetical protein BGI34_10605 [Snodgrassella alvi]PIT59249.1 hypothetical protein BHC57_09260 [Snodgrassella alvi]